MTRGERVIAFIERFCCVPEGNLVGRPMHLVEFERDFILRVYDNPAETRMAILSIAKKNGKTPLIAALVLAHVAGPEAVLNSRIGSGAMGLDQAALVFDYAVKMIRMNAQLGRVIRVIPSHKKLIGLARNVEYRALAKEAKRKQGVSLAVAILDEVGEVRGPRDDFFEMIMASQGAYEAPLLIIISTQAASDADMLSVLIDDAKTGADPQTVLVLHEAPKDCALDDEAAWKAANPALGIFRSYSDIKRQAEKAKRMPAFAPKFRNWHLNQRVETVSPFVSRDAWRKCGGELVPHEAIWPVFAALDLSAIADLTSLIAIWRAAGKWNVAARFWAPEQGVRERADRDKAPYDLWAEQGFLRLTPGATVDYDFVAAELLEAAAEWNLQAVAFDRWRIDVFKAALSRQDAPEAFVEKMQPFGQGFQSMSPALDALETEVLAGRIAHGGNPLLAACMMNAVVTMDPAGNRKLDKAKRRGRIDGAVALTMAMGIAAAAGQLEAASFWEQAA